MRPAFSNALYYPDIDIQNMDWLKTSILFWDSISTIVPESLENPYKQRDTQYLSDIGFLRPLIVHPNDRSIKEIEQDIFFILQNFYKFFVHHAIMNIVEFGIKKMLIIL